MFNVNAEGGSELGLGTQADIMGGEAAEHVIRPLACHRIGNLGPETAERQSFMDESDAPIDLTVTLLVHGQRRIGIMEPERAADRRCRDQAIAETVLPLHFAAHG